jgi:hypothetical protein
MIIDEARHQRTDLCLPPWNQPGDLGEDLPVAPTIYYERRMTPLLLLTSVSEASR